MAQWPKPSNPALLPFPCAAHYHPRSAQPTGLRGRACRHSHFCVDPACLFLRQVGPCGRVFVSSARHAPSLACSPVAREFGGR
jgi:hypothetical protein